MRKQILESLKSHATGQLNKHKMNIEIYLHNPVGVGEHSDILETIEKELEMVAKYNDQIDMLNKYFKD
jgi:hypothetical protein